jgi:hypothetical protein
MNSDTWHRFYCLWYDHRKAGHRVRAAIYGWITDRIAACLKPDVSSRVGDAFGTSRSTGGES